MTDASLAIIEHSRHPERILAVWNERYRAYTLPGGLHEQTDISSTGAMMREVFEETQLTVEISELIHVDNIADPLGRATRVFTHWVPRVGGVDRAVMYDIDASIHPQLVWITKRQFLDQTPWREYTAAAFILLDTQKAA